MIDRRHLLASLAALTTVPSLTFGSADAAPERVIRFASSGDTAIVTNAELIEIDPGLPPVADLARRLGHAPRQQKVLDHIARSQARHLALGSVTLNAPPSEELICDFQRTLDRQGEFVSHDFGPLAVDDLPMFIATAVDNTPLDYTVLAAVLDTLNYITNKSGFWPGATVTRAWDVFCMAGAMRRPGAIDLIALWPFKNVEKKRRV